MPPPPPLVLPSDAAAFLEWLAASLGVGYYRLEVADEFTPQIAPEGALVFKIGDKVFTIWEA